MQPVKQAVILVGGRGTRLGSLTANLPKPMLRVGGAPFLEYVLEYLRRFGVARVLFCSGYLAGHIEEHFGVGNRLGFEIRYSVEESPAGTGGALLRARHLLEAVFYVLNGDTLFETDLVKLSEALCSGGEDRLGAIALRNSEDVARYGSIRMESDRIVEFAEKRGAGPGLVNGGVYCLRQAVLAFLPGPPCSLEGDLFPQAARAGRMGGLRSEGYFIDIGLPESLARAEMELPARFGGRDRRRVFAGRSDPLQIDH